ncbi:MAG: hypothetical protein NTV51_20040, partial [Verrucomicrobia bacterium]|nr:hypothetical protein [Verrucomicrobiota bacterium]
LARLGPDAPADGAALARLRAVGAGAAQSLPALRQALATGGPAGLAAAFRPVLQDPDTGRALGAFALKLMPHLMPPTEGDPALWQTLLDEFAELCALMQAVGEPGRK